MEQGSKRGEGKAVGGYTLNQRVICQYRNISLIKLVIPSRGPSDVWGFEDIGADTLFMFMIGTILYYLFK